MVTHNRVCSIEDRPVHAWAYTDCGVENSSSLWFMSSYCLERDIYQYLLLLTVINTLCHFDLVAIRNSTHFFHSLTLYSGKWVINCYKTLIPQPLENTPTPIFAESYCTGSFITWKSTQHTKIIYSSMRSDEIRSVHVCVGRSSVWPRETSARQRHYRTSRIIIGGCARLVQLLWLLHWEELLT